MISLFIDAVYLTGALLFGPWYLILRLIQGRSLASPWRRMGFVPPLEQPGPPVIWLHAVSVGEALALRRLVAELESGPISWRIVITCTTSAGLEVARKTWPELLVLECPFDLGCSVRRFLARIRPRLLLLVEVELWPNLLRILARRGVPVAVVNGRLSARSARGYAWLRLILPGFLAPVRAFCLQEQIHAQRLQRLGVGSPSLHVTGNLKYDNLELVPRDPPAEDLRARLGWSEAQPVLVAGSTHAGEDDILLDAFCALRREIPDLRMVLAPRHLKRLKTVERAVCDHGQICARFSQPQEAALAGVLLLDSLGELPQLYALADVAFVGGSLVPVGGHNLLEPAALGLPVLVGPQLHAVREIADDLLAAGALCVVKDAQQLYDGVLEFLRDPEKVQRAAAGAGRVIAAQRGAVARSLAILEPLLQTTLKESDHHG